MSLTRNQVEDALATPIKAATLDMAASVRVLHEAACLAVRILPDTNDEWDAELVRSLSDPPLYEFTTKQVEALEALGVQMLPTKPKYILAGVVDVLTVEPIDP